MDRKLAVGGGMAAALCVLLIALPGCASKVVPSQGPRPATSANDVQIYQKAPKKYEALGPVKQVVTPDMRFDHRGDSTVGFDRLKGLAAEKGANGLLLITNDPSAGMQVTAGYRGSFYQVPMTKGEPRAVMGQAIYVLEP